MELRHCGRFTANRNTLRFAVKMNEGSLSCIYLPIRELLRSVAPGLLAEAAKIAHSMPRYSVTLHSWGGVRNEGKGKGKRIPMLSLPLL